MQFWITTRDSRDPIRPAWRALVGSLLATCLASTGSAQPPTDAWLIRQIDSAGKALISQGKAPAMSIAVSRNGAVVYLGAFGSADLENSVAATPETVFEIGSITKQFTAAAVMQLVEAGKLSLDDRLTTFWPDWPASAKDVTIRRLLTHTSGIKDYTGLRSWPLLKTHAVAIDSMVAILESQPFDFAPGTRFQYDNSGYYLLGAIVARVSGESYADYVGHHFARPLGLSTLRYCDQRALIPHRSRGYSVDPSGGFRNAAYQEMSTPYAAGALCSTAADLARWTEALENGKVVTPASYLAMTTPPPLSDGTPGSYGFGLGVGDLAGHRLVSHNGGIDGYRSQLASYPADHLVIAVLVNGESDLPDRFEKTVARWALGIPIVPPKDLAVSAEDAARFVGTYEADDQRMRVFLDGEKLEFQLPMQPASRMLYQGGGVFVLETNPDFELQFTMDGPIARRLVLKVPGGTLALDRRP